MHKGIKVGSRLIIFLGCLELTFAFSFSKDRFPFLPAPYSHFLVVFLESIIEWMLSPFCDYLLLTGTTCDLCFHNSLSPNMEPAPLGLCDRFLPLRWSYGCVSYSLLPRGDISIVLNFIPSSKPSRSLSLVKLICLFLDDETTGVLCFFATNGFWLLSGFAVLLLTPTGLSRKSSRFASSDYLMSEFYSGLPRSISEVLLFSALTYYFIKF